MNKMKKILIPFILMLAFLVSCENDEYETPFGDFSSFQWFTSTDTQNANYVIALDKYIAFRDVSQNALSHTWSIPIGTSLLNSKFTVSDSIYTSFISANGALNTEEKLINVLFREPGIKEIKLQNVFKDSVTNAVIEDGNWKVDQIFTIEVFDNIKPAFKIMKGTEELLTVSETDIPSAASAASWPTVTLEAGEQLTYIDLTTTGKPDGRTWNFNGGAMDMSEAETVNLSYNGLGNYTVGSITSKRTSSDKPDGEATKLIPLKIEVIPSTQPFVLNGMITENATEVISFNVTGEITRLVAEENNFIVHVVNAAATPMFDQNITVQSATLNATDATQIDLVLSAPIYNSDEITVTYTAGNIGSVDFRVLESFSATNVVMHKNDNIIGEDYAGFEIESTNWKAAFCEGLFVGNSNDVNNNTIAPYYFERVTNLVNSGNASMKYESPNGIKTINIKGINFTKGAADPHGISTLPAGTYQVSYMVYLQTGNTMLAFNTIVQGGDVTLWDVSTLPRGEWIEVSEIITVASGLTNKKFDIKMDASNNIGVTGEQIIYFDDLSWRPLEIR